MRTLILKMKLMTMRRWRAVHALFSSRTGARCCRFLLTILAAVMGVRRPIRFSICQDFPKKTDVAFVTRAHATFMAALGHPKTTDQAMVVACIQQLLRSPYHKINRFTCADWNAFLVEMRRVQKKEDRLTDRLRQKRYQQRWVPQSGNQGKGE